MRKNEREQIAPEESVLEREIEGNPSACIDLQTAISIIMEKVSAGCPIEELMSVAADVAMKYHDGDSAFFFNPGFVIPTSCQVKRIPPYESNRASVIARHCIQ
ncbi:MAG: hypothetical protein LUE61_04985 [Clostridiales bacterium]|nr:hypothetical protein [Clostridiales bacterium]